jgi:hypothetical protein
MAELISEGYAVSVKTDGDHILDRQTVAVFRSQIFAEMWAKYAYGYGNNDQNNPAEPEVNHVFFGVEAF